MEVAPRPYAALRGWGISAGAAVVIGLVALDAIAWEVISRTPLLEDATHSQPAVRLRFAISGAALFGVAAVLAVRLVRRRRAVRLLTGEILVGGMLALAVLAGVVGLAHGNQLAFVAGDTFRLLIVPAATFVTVTALRPPDVRPVVLAYVLFGAVAAVLLIGEAVQAALEGRTAYGLGSVSTVLIAFLLCRLAEHDGPRREPGHLVTALGVAVLLGLNLLSLGQGEWLSSALTVALWLGFYGRRALRALVPIALAAALAGAALVLAAPGFVERSAERAEQRLERLTGKNDATGRRTFNNRGREVDEALSHLARGPASAYLVGLGSGAEYRTARARTDPTSRPGHRHHIHVTLASVFFRMGAIGLALVLAILILAVWGLVVVARGVRSSAPAGRETVAVLAIWLGVSLLGIFASYGFIGQLGWGVMLGLIGVLLRERARAGVSALPARGVVIPLRRPSRDRRR